MPARISCPTYDDFTAKGMLGSNSMRLLVTFVSAVAVFACSSAGGNDGGNSDGGYDGGSTITADHACDNLALATCQQRNVCEPATLIQDFGDLNTCIARQKSACLNSLSAIGTGATAATQQACADAYHSWSCADWFNGIVPAACRPRMGQKPNGNPC